MDKCKDCLCIDCESDFGTIKEECHCKICIKEDWDSLGWCREYREKEEMAISGKQESMF